MLEPINVTIGASTFSFKPQSWDGKRVTRTNSQDGIGIGELIVDHTPNKDANKTVRHLAKLVLPISYTDGGVTKVAPVTVNFTLTAPANMATASAAAVAAGMLDFLGFEPKGESSSRLPAIVAMEAF